MSFESSESSTGNKKEKIEPLYNEEGQVNDPEIAESMAHSKERFEGSILIWVQKQVAVSLRQRWKISEPEYTKVRRMNLNKSSLRI